MDRWSSVFAVIDTRKDAQIYRSTFTRLKDRFETAVIDGGNTDDIMREYNMFLDQMISVAASDIEAMSLKKCSMPTRKREVKSTIMYCECGAHLVLDEANFQAHCERCLATTDLVGLQMRERVERKPAKSNNINKELETLELMLLMMEGGIPEQKITQGAVRKPKQKTIREEVDELSDRILAQLRLSYPDPSMIHIEHIRTLLTAMDLRRMCKVAPYFYYAHTGYKPIVMTDVEKDRIREMYVRILNVWKTANGQSFRNLPCCRTIIYEILGNISLPTERVIKLRSLLYLPEKSTYHNFINNFWKPVQKIL